MENTIPNDLYQEFMKLLEHGTERQLKDFLTSNIKRFPDAIRDQIIAAFVEEAIIDSGKKAQALATFRKEGINAVKGMEHLKAALQAKAKILELKEKA